MSRNADGGFRAARRVARAVRGPKAIRDSTVEAASPAAHTSRRFSAPMSWARGLVSNPPMTEPRIPPPANSGNRRFACRVSTTDPATPQSETPMSSVPTAAVTHRAT
jgi:hypothetical protein